MTVAFLIRREAANLQKAVVAAKAAAGTNLFLALGGFISQYVRLSGLTGAPTRPSRDGWHFSAPKNVERQSFRYSAPVSAWKG
jgi:hypothetical protein